MSAQQTIDSLKQYCTLNSDDIFGQIWQGNKATYRWNSGKYDSAGTLNGVVRKLVGIDTNSQQIWVVAGSFKIAADGTILRFTGLPKRYQATVEQVSVTPVATQTTVTV